MTDYNLLKFVIAVSALALITISTWGLYDEITSKREWEQFLKEHPPYVDPSPYSYHIKGQIDTTKQDGTRKWRKWDENATDKDIN